MGDLSNSDVALLSRNGGFGMGENSIIWLFAIILLFGMIGGNGFNNNNGNYVTQSEMTAGLNNLSSQQQLQQIALSSANNNYETAQLINGQTMQMMQQNNTNQINLLQGYNQLQMQMMQQTSGLQQQINQLSYQMDQCCCSIKTQMLQDRLDDANAKIVSQNGDISNANQTQTILNTMGRWVGWSTTGTQAASVNS